MYEPQYEFQAQWEKANREKNAKRRAQWMPRIFVASIVTAALVVGAVYGPMIMNITSVSATDAPARVLPVTTGAPAMQSSVSLFTDQEALANLYDQIAPSVVNIQVLNRAAPISGFPQEGAPSGGQGSGFIYDYDGHIVTNNHVVEDAQEVTVVFHNGFWADAEVIATDPQADLAVIKVTPPDNYEWRPLPLAEADALRVGHTVIAMGNPFGLANTMTTGIVSAMGRGLPVGDTGSARYTLPDVIQTDAAINPGNSGGPLLNLQGEVVGVNFAIESAVRSNSGVGFTIPVSIVKRVVPALINDGAFNYSYLGISGQSISSRVAEVLGMDDNLLGIHVDRVIAGGPSADAGVEGSERNARNEIDVAGDIITAINGEQVRQFEDLVGYLVTETSPGDIVTLSILRNGQAISVDVELGTRPGSVARSQSTPRGVNARGAIAIATELVEGDNLLDGEIAEKVATPDERNGVEVWVVELSDGEQTATVIVEKETGDVVSFDVQ
ncbi:MAG: trypsin-like peptidase domain-containing protein [Chloroflexota bacterium]